MVVDIHARYRNTTATLWEVDDRDSAGDPVYSSASPREISVRWEDKKTTFTGADGETISASSYIITGEALEVGDVVVKGSSVAAEPDEVEGAYVVMGTSETYSPSGRYVNYMAFLSFRRTL